MKIAMKYIENKFKKNLHEKIPNLKLRNIEECDFILFFCFIVSRAETDINAALDEFNSRQVLKPAILVVLHHTFESETFIPDSNATVNRQQILAVDCVFNEDDGFLECQRNNDALDKIEKRLKAEKLTSYACLKDHDGESSPLLHTEERSLCQKYNVLIILLCVGTCLLVLLLCLLVFFWHKNLS